MTKKEKNPKNLKKQDPKAKITPVDSEFDNFQDLIENDFDLSDFIAKSEIRLWIIILFLFYPELSYSGICKKLEFSKSTIHKHLMVLSKMGILKKTRKEKVRKNVYKTLYSLNSEVFKIINLEKYSEEKDLTKEEKVNLFRHTVQMTKSLSILYQTIIERLYDYFYEHIYPDNKITDISNALEFVDDINPIMTYFRVMNRKQFEFYMEGLEELQEKAFKKFQDTLEEDQKIDYDYAVFHSGIDLKKLLEYRLKEK